MLANWVKLSRAHVLSRFDYSGFARARDGNASGQSLTSTDGSKGEMIGSDIVMTEIIPRPDRRPCTVGLGCSGAAMFVRAVTFTGCQR